MWIWRGLSVCWLCVALAFGGWLVGCEYDISIPTGETAIKEGVAGSERLSKDAGEEVPEPQNEASQESEPSETSAVCDKEVACFRCFVEVVSDESMVATYGKLLILRRQDAHSVVDLETCRRRALVATGGGALQIIPTAGFPLLMERRVGGAVQGEVVRLAWVTNIDKEVEWVVPKGRVWMPNTTAPFLGARGFLSFPTAASSGKESHLTVFFDSINATFSVPTNANWEPVYYHFSPERIGEKQYDVIMFLDPDKRHHAMVWDVQERRVLSQMLLPERPWLQGHVCFGGERLVLAEYQTDAMGIRRWSLHLRGVREISQSIFRMDLEERNIYSLPCWYDGAEGSFWVLLQKEMLRVHAETGKHERMPLPSSPLVGRWLGPKQGRMWALGRDGEVGDWRVESGNLVWRSLGATQRFSSVEGCQTMVGDSSPNVPYIVLRESVGTTDRHRLWRLFLEAPGGRLQEAGEALVPAVMGRMTEFLRCYEAGFSYIADDGQKMEYTAFYGSLSKPLFRSEMSLQELSNRSFPQNNRRIELLALDGLQGEIKEVRWQLIDFSHGKIQQEKVFVDVSVYTPWGIASDVYVILRGVEGGRHRLAVYRVR